MSIVDFIAVVSFGLTCFGIGYSFGKDNNKTQKQNLNGWMNRMDKFKSYDEMLKQY